MSREGENSLHPSRLRVAGLDLGTNTCLVLIADVTVLDHGIDSFSVLRDEVRVVRLGQGVNTTRALHPEALARAEETFREFSAYIRDAGCERVLAVATSAARDATNGQSLIDLGAKYGIPVEIISGEKEAELTFAGAIEPSWSGLTSIIDVGGGSTEIIFGDQNGIRLRFSADVGSVRLTERFVTAHPISSQEIETLRQTVRASLETGLERAIKAPLTRERLLSQVSQVVGVAGTPTTLAAVDLGRRFESERVHGHVFSKSGLDAWIVKLAAMTVEERQKLAGMEPKRADVIVAGAICVSEAMGILGASSLKVSVRGLRFGVAGLVALR